MEPVLTIGMASWDDYYGVWGTVQALRMYHPEVMDRTEILVVHNSPNTPDAKATRSLMGENGAGWVENGRYIPFPQIAGTTAPRDHIFREARGEMVLVIDPHVLIPAGALAKLIAYHEANPESRDLLHGPGLYDDLRPTNVNTHMNPAWRDKMFGTWGNDKRGHDPNGEPFEIPMHGLGLFAMRKAAWVGMPQRCRGFGGEEGCLHEKVRQAGGRSLCLPFLQWAHRFHPEGFPITYANNDFFRVRNYLLWRQELGKPFADICEHFAGTLAANQVEHLRMEFGLVPEFEWLEIRENVNGLVTPAEGLVPDGNTGTASDGTESGELLLVADLSGGAAGTGDPQQQPASDQMGWKRLDSYPE